MPLSEDVLLQTACLGVAAESFENLEQVQDRIEEFLSEVLPICRRHLKGLEDGSIRRRNEKDLSSSLCKWLTVYARERQVVFTFANEEPDKSRKDRTNDMAAVPGFALLRVGAEALDADDHLYIIEAKLLPPPDARTGQSDRSREYVVGDWADRDVPYKAHRGGIERFKERKHGAGFLRAAMIAFVLTGSASSWHTAVNGWIDDLIASTVPSHEAAWSPADRLSAVVGKGRESGVAEFISINSRSNGAQPVTLRHFWLQCC